MQQATAGQFKDSHRKASAAKSAHGSRTRPTNNQLLYRATFQWEHYRRSLYGSPKLPSATEACASVTSAFLQVVGVLFEVERLREDQPRNILRLLSTNTRRTKVVELSSGTHRVPDELKRHSIGDGEGGQYSTNLDRNRYGSDDQYLATVVRYNLEFLDLCPCLVDVTILDAKGGEVAVVVCAGPTACLCRSGATRQSHQDGKQRTIRTVGGRSLDLEEQQLLREGVLPREKTPLSPTAHSGEPSRHAERRLVAAAPSRSNNGSELFDALLMAAAEPPVTSRQKPLLTRILPRSPRLDGDSSRGESEEGKEEETPKAANEEPLRRSLRKSVKLFNAAALEREESAGSEDEGSAQSIEDDTEVAPRHSRASADDWEGSFLQSRGRRGGPVRGASAANLPKLAASAQGQELWRRQQDSRKMQQELQRVILMLEESQAQEAAAQLQVRQLQQELASRGGQRGSRDLVDAEPQLLKTESSLTDGQRSFSSSQSQELSEKLLSSALLREAHDVIAKLQKEKLALCNALSTAGLPLPLPPMDLPTPQRNGESPLNGFAGQPIGTPGNSAFSVPLALQAFPGLHQFQRAFSALNPAALKVPLAVQKAADDSPGPGSAVQAAAFQGSSPRLLKPVPVPSFEASRLGGNSDRRNQVSPEQEESRPGAALPANNPVKRKFEEELGTEYKAPCNGERLRIGDLQPGLTARSH